MLKTKPNHSFSWFFFVLSCLLWFLAIWVPQLSYKFVLTATLFDFIAIVAAYYAQAAVYCPDDDTAEYDEGNIYGY